ncbi:MAG: nuclear transport factor 2 family protein [Planctomycetota bacterium]
MTDEAAIREWFDQWINATTRGDAALASTLVADDAIFLVPGPGKMNKQSFIAAATAEDPTGNHDFELDCAIDEIRVAGNTAQVIARLQLDVIEKATGKRSRSSGYSLSFLERRDGKWVTVREANTMKGDPVAE